MEGVLICVVLPIAIVLIVHINSINRENKRAQVLIKAIEAGNGMDVDRLAEALNKPKKSAREILDRRLLRGCILSLIGLVLMVVGLVSLFTGEEFSSDSVSVPLIFGGIALAIGVSYLIVYRMTRNEADSSDSK